MHESEVCHENEIKNLFLEIKFVVVSCSDQLGFHSRQRCYLERIDFATLIQLNKFDCQEHSAEVYYRQLGVNYESSKRRKPVSTLTIASIINCNKYYDLFKRFKLMIIASTFPVVTAGNLKASRLQCRSIIFMSFSEIFSEGVISTQRLRFCQFLIYDGKNLNLLCFVAFS